MIDGVIILGAGGHAKVIIDILNLRGIKIIGITTPEPDLVGTSISNLPILGSDDVINEYSPERVRLINGIGSIGVPNLRGRIFECFKQKGYLFLDAIHPTAIISKDVKLGEGIQIMAGVIIQTGCNIGDNVIINTGTVVEHECIIEKNVHLAPRVTLSGNVHISETAHVGIGSTAIQGVYIGARSLVGAGALVIRNVRPNTKVIGVPAREV